MTSNVLQSASADQSNQVLVNPDFLAANLAANLIPACSAIDDLTTELVHEENPHKRIKKLSKIRKTVRCITDYFNELINYIQITQNKNPVIFSQIQFPNLLKRLSDSVSSTIKIKQIDFKIHYQKELPNILLSDYFRVETIVRNLVSNAVKFTQHGQIQLSFTKENETEEILTMKITVKDSGNGIPDDLKDKVFLPFFTTMPKKSKPHNSPGLGLSITNKFLEDLGGTIYMKKNSNNQGMTFTCLLPFRIETKH